MVLSVTPGPVLTPSAPSPALPEESALELQPVPASSRAATAAARSDVVRGARGVWCVWCEDFTGWAPWLVRLTRVVGTGRRRRRVVGWPGGGAGGRAGAGPDRAVRRGRTAGSGRSPLRRGSGPPRWGRPRRRW